MARRRRKPAEATPVRIEATPVIKKISVQDPAEQTDEERQFGQSVEQWLEQGLESLNAARRGEDVAQEPAGGDGEVDNASASPADPAPPDALALIRAEMAADRQSFTAALAEVTKRIETLREPDPPPEPVGDLDSLMGKLIAGVAGDNADPGVRRELTQAIEDAIAARRFSGHESWKDNPEAQQFAEQATSRLSHAAERARDRREFRQHIADLTAKVEELSNRPVREAEQAKRVQFIADMLGQRPIDGSDPVAKATPTIARLARDMGLSSKIAEHVLTAYRAQREQDWDGNAPEIWGPVHHLEQRVKPMIEALETATAEARTPMAAAFKAALGGDSPLTGLIDAAIQSFGDAAVEPTRSVSPPAGPNRLDSRRPPIPRGRGVPNAEPEMTMEEWFNASDDTIAQRFDTFEFQPPTSDDLN